MKKKESTEYTGIESYVACQILSDEIAWIPLGRATVLQRLDEEKDVVHDRLLSIQDELTRIEAILNKA